jgi:hypothetical protein
MGLEGPIAGNFVRPDDEALNSDAKSVQTEDRLLGGRGPGGITERKSRIELPYAGNSE